MTRTHINLALLIILALSTTLQAARLVFPKLVFPKNETEWAKALAFSHPRNYGTDVTKAGQHNNANVNVISADHFPRAGAMVQFDFNSASVRPSGNSVLDALGRSLGGALSDATIIVEGHTDASGTAEYSLRLSKLRAEAVRNYLISQHGIAPERLQTAAFGEKHPIADNSKEFGRVLNRRIEFVRIH